MCRLSCLSIWLHFCMCLQSCYRYNGDCRLEVNDPVPSSLGSRSLSCPGFSTVPTLRSSQEAPKTVLTARLCPRTLLEVWSMGLQKRRTSKDATLYFHQNWTHLNKEEWGFLARDVGEAGTWKTDINWLGGGKKKLVHSVLLACFAARTEFCSDWVASQALCYSFIFPVIFKMALIYLPLLWSCSGVLCLFYSVPALSQRPGLLQVALVPMNSHFDMEFYRNVTKV